MTGIQELWASQRMLTGFLVDGSMSDAEIAKLCNCDESVVAIARKSRIVQELKNKEFRGREALPR